MKRLFPVLILFLFLGACKEEKKEFYGDPFTQSNVIPVTEMVAEMEKSENKEKVRKEYQFSAKIVEVDMLKGGMWVKVDKGDGKPMPVIFDKVVYTVPHTVMNKNAIFKGEAYYRVIPVDQLRYKAAEAGKSQAEIDAITSDEYMLEFDATGVLIVSNGEEK